MAFKYRIHLLVVLGIRSAAEPWLSIHSLSDQPTPTVFTSTAYTYPLRDCRTAWGYPTSRPCPTLSCPPEETPRGPCTPAPDSVIYPGFPTYIVDGCTAWHLTGAACPSCGDNWCTREPLPGETGPVTMCPWGFSATTMEFECSDDFRKRRAKKRSAAEERHQLGIGSNNLEEPGLLARRDMCPWRWQECPTTPLDPAATFEPRTQVWADRCGMTVETGMPCETRCALTCSVPGQIPYADVGYACGATSTDGDRAFWTMTTDAACPTILCRHPYSAGPTECTTHEEQPTVTTETFGCDVYVQTARSCPSCPQYCTTAP